MSAHKEAWQVMMSADALCPTERSHPERMRWMAGYFLANFAIEQPALAAPVKECLTTELPLPERDGDWAGDDWYTAATLRAHTARAVAAALATPPASAQAVAQHIPANFTTHRSAWRDAIVMARDSAPSATVDSDERGYWQHELDAFDRSFYRLLAGELRRQAVAPAQVEQKPRGWLTGDSSHHRQGTLETFTSSYEFALSECAEWNRYARQDNDPEHIDRVPEPLYTRPQAAQPAAQDSIEAAELQTLLLTEFECYRPTYPAGIMAWARSALLDNSPHRAKLAAQVAGLTDTDANRIADILKYPGEWDIAAYPNIGEALIEFVSAHSCPGPDLTTQEIDAIANKFNWHNARCCGTHYQFARAILAAKSAPADGGGV